MCDNSSIISVWLWVAGPREALLMSGESFHLENQELTQAAAMTLCTDLLLLLTVGVCHGWGCCLSWEMFSSSLGWMGEEMGKGEGEEKTIKQKRSVSLSWSAKKNKIKIGWSSWGFRRFGPRYTSSGWKLSWPSSVGLLDIQSFYSAAVWQQVEPLTLES